LEGTYEIDEMHLFVEHEYEGQIGFIDNGAVANAATRNAIKAAIDNNQLGSMVDALWNDVYAGWDSDGSWSINRNCHSYVTWHDDFWMIGRDAQVIDEVIYADYEPVTEFGPDLVISYGAHHARYVHDAANEYWEYVETPGDITTLAVSAISEVNFQSKYYYTDDQVLLAYMSTGPLGEMLDITDANQAQAKATQRGVFIYNPQD
jgi:hypothetical protein